MNRRLSRLSDAELLARCARDPEVFGAFYRRHERLLLRYLLHRSRDAELAADLLAETFAVALELADRFDPERTGDDGAIPWLLAIARSIFFASVRRGAVAEGARRRLGVEPVELTDAALARVEELASLDLDVDDLLADLPPNLREAVTARVLDEREYAEIATALGCSQLVVRKRVSRGLSRLRSTLNPSAG